MYTGKSLRWLLLPFLVTHTLAQLENAYCSPDNTGGDVVVQSIYMSMGKCHDTCDPSFAFAILQDSNCWCSNFAPPDQVAVGNCNVKCPGFPNDTCGNSGEGLYGYLKLDIAASGTASGSSSAQKTSSPSATTPITSVQVVTVSGNMVTQTVTTMPSTGSSALLGGQQKKSSGISGGVIAAAVIAAVFGTIIIGALIFFFWRRRKRDVDDEKFGDINDNPTSAANLNRNASTNSKAGLLDRGYPPTITTRVSSNGLDMSSDAVSPVTPNSDHRNSRPIMYDQRLNPNALMVIDNGSHTSLNTLDDHRDYGRMLKVINPDDPPRPSIS